MCGVSLHHLSRGTQLTFVFLFFFLAIVWLELINGVYGLTELSRIPSVSDAIMAVERYSSLVLNLQASVYDIPPPASAVTGYTTF